MGAGLRVWTPQKDWVTYGNRIYVADIDKVVIADMQKGGIVTKIAIPGASGLQRYHGQSG